MNGKAIYRGQWITTPAAIRASYYRRRYFHSRNWVRFRFCFKPKTPGIIFARGPSEPGSLLVMPGFLLAAKQRVTWSTAVAAQFCSPVPRPTCAGGKNFAAFAAAKCGLRAVAQAMARELGPKNIHVAHLITDGPIDSPEIHRRFMVDKGIDASTRRRTA